MLIEIKNKNESYTVNLTHGHLRALDDIMYGYGIVDRRKALEYVLSSVRQTNGKGVGIGLNGGVLEPNPNIKL